MAVDCVLYDGLSREEDTVIEAKGLRVEVKVAGCGWVVGGFVAWPDDILDKRRNLTEFGGALVAKVWRFGPDAAVTGFGWIADVSWRAAPECIVSGSLGSDRSSVGWLWTSK